MSSAGAGTSSAGIRSALPPLTTPFNKQSSFLMASPSGGSKGASVGTPGSAGGNPSTALSSGGRGRTASSQKNPMSAAFRRSNSNKALPIKFPTDGGGGDDDDDDGTSGTEALMSKTYARISLSKTTVSKQDLFGDGIDSDELLAGQAGGGAGGGAGGDGPGAEGRTLSSLGRNRSISGREGKARLFGDLYGIVCVCAHAHAIRLFNWQC